MAVEWGNPSVLVPVVGGLLMFLAAGYFLFLDFESRLYRSFAVFLVLRGLATAGTGFLFVPSWEPYWAAVTPYFAVALPFSLAYFAYVYRTQSASARHHAWVLPALVVPAFVLEIFYARDHALFTSRGPQGEVLFGPFFAAVGVLYVLYALLAGRLVRDRGRTTSPDAKAGLLLAAVAFALICLNSGVYYLFSLLLTPLGLPGERRTAAPGQAPPWGVIVLVLLIILSALLTIPVFLRIRRERRRGTMAPTTARRALQLLMLPALTGLASLLARIASLEWSTRLVQTFDAVWALAFVVLIAYALLRHSLFGADPRIRILVTRGTIGAAFVALFFILSEGTQTAIQAMALTNRVPQGVASLIGVAGAGLLVFALHPLQRAAERLSQGAIPARGPIEKMTGAERLSIYRDQVLLAWGDGTLTRKERLMLDKSRERLGISIEESTRIEEAVLRGAPAPRGARSTRA